MADRASTQVGFRLRGFAPTDLSTYPDAIKRQFWQWVVDAALRVKDRELARGWDKDGNVHPLAARTIKYRKSEVGPVTKNAPRLIPALALSRVRSLLRGRAHTTSAELFWTFDAVTGESFAVILHYAAQAGHDVFGITPRGTARVREHALTQWQAWKVQAGHARPSVLIPGFPAPVRIVKRPVRRPIARQPVVKVDLKKYDLTGGEKSLIEKAIAAGRFQGVSRINLRGSSGDTIRNSGGNSFFSSSIKPRTTSSGGSLS